MRRVVLEPRIRPLSLSDGVIAAAVAATQLLIFAAPGLLVLAFTKNQWLSIALLIAVPLFFSLHCISETAVDQIGIHFKRPIGNPKLIRWSQVTSIHEVAAKEVIVHGWLWPLIPAREMTPSLSARGHYRIQYGERWVYFPPEQPNLLLERWNEQRDAR